MSGFEAKLSECLEALREGRWDLDECLRRYPEHAAALRPQLLAALAVTEAFAAAPREEFARLSRERFLIATGQRLSEVYDNDPEPSFFAAARLRFLLAAQRMGLAEQRKSRRFMPGIHAGARAFAGAAAAFVLFLSFSTYTVASANSALPGDWQYPVKLQTERVRLALAFSDSSKRGVHLDIAEERARELEELTRHGRIIGPGVLDRIVEQTQPLLDGATGDGGWDTQDIARLKSVAEREQRAIEDARPQVPPDAQDELAQAAVVSKQAADAAGKILVERPDSPPLVIKPKDLLSKTPAGETSTPAAQPSATPGASTPGAISPTAAMPTPSTPGELVIGPTPEVVRGGIVWNRVAVGRFTTLIPSEASGWHIIDTGGGNSPSLIKLSNSDGTSLITLNPRTADMYWFTAHDGRFDEVQMRLMEGDGTVRVQEAATLRDLYGDAAAIPLYILDNIEVAPEPTPTPSPVPVITGTVIAILP